MIRHFGLVVSMLWALGPHVLRGQPLVAPGARVRVVDHPYRRPVVIGSFVRLVGDSVFVVDSAGVPHALIVDGRRRLELSEGKRPHVLEGIGIGLVLGAAVGAGIGAYFSSSIPGASAAAGARRFALPGILIGGFFGSIPRERWRRVSGNQVTIPPGATQGVHVGLSLGF